jgi:hypothetical protein
MNWNPNAFGQPAPNAAQPPQYGAPQPPPPQYGAPQPAGFGAAPPAPAGGYAGPQHSAAPVAQATDYSAMGAAQVTTRNPPIPDGPSVLEFLGFKNVNGQSGQFGVLEFRVLQSDRYAPGTVVAYVQNKNPRKGGLNAYFSRIKPPFQALLGYVVASPEAAALDPHWGSIMTAAERGELNGKRVACVGVPAVGQDGKTYINPNFSPIAQ